MRSTSRRPRPGAPSKAAALLESLDLLAKKEDPTRFTTLADCCEIAVAPSRAAAIAALRHRDAIVGIADTVGYNRYFGWYTGRFEDFGPMLDEAHARHPALPMAVSEYGAGAALTQHTDDPAGGPINPHGRPHPEEYQSLVSRDVLERTAHPRLISGRRSFGTCSIFQATRGGRAT